MRTITKTILIALLAVIGWSGSVNAQQTTPFAIPDAHFFNYLINNTSINTNFDGSIGFISVAEAANYSGVIYVQSLSIADLTGISAFTALTGLYCNNNQLTSLNVSANTALTALYCYSNQLTSLDVSANTALAELSCYSNQLTSLNVSASTGLVRLICNINQLTSLNLQNGNNATISNGNFSASGNPNLTCIQVDNMAYSTATWTQIDPGANFSTNCAGTPDSDGDGVPDATDTCPSLYGQVGQACDDGNINTINDEINSSCQCVGIALPCIVSIPDANFKAALVGNPAINTNGDTEIQCSEAAAYTGVIDVHGLSIANLTGISAFTALTQLYCYNNPLTSLNVSSNTALTGLICVNNQLTSLNVSANTALVYLHCGFNLLTSLIVSANTALNELSCRGNQLTSLNVSANTALVYLECYNNRLTSLNVSANTALTYLTCNNNQLTSLNMQNWNNPNFSTFNAFNNPNLTCIQVDVVAYSSANWTQIDAVTHFSTNCSGPIAPVASSPQTFCGSATVANLVATGTNLQWYSVATSGTALATSAALATGTYYVSQTVGGVESARTAVSVTVNAITLQPQNTNLCPALGSTASISVATTAVSPTYVWEYRVVTSGTPNPAWITITGFNAGAVYSSYTTGTLGITRATTTLPLLGTEYRVTVSQGSCSITSSVAKLTISSAATVGTITQSATSVCTGNTVMFTLGGYVGTSIQWQSSATPYSTSVPPANWTAISGATNAIYTTTPLTTTSNRYYRAVITNSCLGLTATTSIKVITVSPLSNGGTITGGGALCLNSPTNNILKVTGFVGIIQWQYSTNNGTSWTNAPSGTSLVPNNIGVFTTTSPSNSSTYNVSNFSTTTWFRVTATSGVCSSATSVNYVACTLTSAVATSVSATDNTVCYNSSTTLTLASGYVGVIKWLKSTNNWVTSSTVPGTAPTVSTGNLTVATAFKAVLTVGGTCVAETAPITITIYASPVAKLITDNATSPTGSTALTALCASNVSKILTIGAGYTGAIQWETYVTSATTPVAPTTTTVWTIIGGSTQSYTITNAGVGKNYFRAKFTNGGCASTAVYSPAFIVYYNACRIEQPIVAANPVKLSFDVVASPNPYKENFNLSLSTSSEERVGIRVYDMIGRLIEQRDVRPSDIDGLQMGIGYPTGVYNIVLSQGTDVKALRVIKR